eukprot:gene25512-33302_t
MRAEIEVEAEDNLGDVYLQDYCYQYELPVRFRIVEDFVKNVFKLERRRVSIKSEILGGFVQFVSCCYVLPVVPTQLSMAGYPSSSAVVVTAACCGIGSLLGGLISNLPFVVAPPTAVSIFLSVYLRQHESMDFHQGGLAVIISGFLLLGLGYRPLGRLFKRLIPHCIQVSSAIGIGLLVALAGCTDIDLVVTGKYTILDLGPLNSENEIALCGFIITGILLHYHFRGAFAVTLIFCSVVSWLHSQRFPAQIAAAPVAPFYNELRIQFNNTIGQLAISLFFLYIICLNGLSRAFADLSKVTNENGRGGVPRGRWLYIICGIMTIISGFYGGPPILISPESAAGIKAGARTGLSTVVAGVLFCFATFFAPLFQGIPNAGTAPILIAIGVLLFVNVKKLDWGDYRKSFPAFAVVVLIPLTFNILYGVLFGYLCYVSIGLFSGDLYKATRRAILFYAPSWHDRLFEFRKSDLTGFEYREPETNPCEEGHYPYPLDCERGSETEAVYNAHTFRDSLLSVLRVFSWKKFWQSLWDELFSFDDKDVLDEPVDFGHSAFDDHISPVDNPVHTSRTTSTAADSSSAGRNRAKTLIMAALDDTENF